MQNTSVIRLENFRKSQTSNSINFDNIQKEKVRNDPTLFYSLATSSFLESTVASFTNNLIQFFSDNPEIKAWLRDTWEPEELLHGDLTRKYIKKVWPEYNWEIAYSNFSEEYLKYCKLDLLRPTKGLEMLARCLTETEAAVYYKALSEYSPDPVLKNILFKMYRDEVKHYKYFLRFFRYYNQIEKKGNISIGMTLFERSKLVVDEDLAIAIRHINKGWGKNPSFSLLQEKEVIQAVAKVSKKYLPFKTTQKMMVKPFDQNLKFYKPLTTFFEWMIHRKMKTFKKTA